LYAAAPLPPPTTVSKSTTHSADVTSSTHAGQGEQVYVNSIVNFVYNCFHQPPYRWWRSVVVSALASIDVVNTWMGDRLRAGKP